MRAFLAPSVGAVLVAVVAAAVLPTGTQAQQQQSLTVTLSEQNGSGVSGTATIMSMGASQAQVVIQLQNAPGPHPIHFHMGTCATLDPAVKIPLTNVVDGRSETLVNASLDEILSMPHAINGRKSPQEASVYVTCGNVVASTAGAPAAQPSPAAKPAAPAQPSPAPKPAAPAQPSPAAKPAAPVQAPAGLPRTGEADESPAGLMALFGGLAMLGTGAFVIWRRRSA